MTKSTTERAGLIVLLGSVVLGHLSLVPNVADLDGFYHIGHAQAYIERSLFDTSLPWATRSIIGDIGGDLWWGFHVLLIPFAALADPPLAMQVAAVVLTTLLALTLVGLLRRHEVPHGAWWATLLLLAVPNVFYRFLMVRPHVVSMAASLALASFLVRGRWWHVAALSAVISWTHLSLFWVAPLLVLTYAVVRVPVTVFLGRETPDTGVPIRAALPAALAGTLLGWLLRPDPLATASLLNVQLVQLFAQKALNQPLTFAAELAPIELLEVARTSWSFLGLWLIGLGLAAHAAARGALARLGQARATLLVMAAALSGGFLLLAVVSARRALEQWVAFGMLMLPLAALAVDRGGSPSAAAEVEASPNDGRVRPAPLRAALAVFLTAHLVWFGQRHLANREEVSFPASTLRPIAEFLEANSERDELVFHGRWDNFGPLLAFNRHNRYLGGMDPIFQYAHDPQAFWEFFYLSADLNTEWTCDDFPCYEGNATDTHVVLTEHFGARWVVVQPYRNPMFTLYLLNDDRYALAHETQSAALFEVLPQ